MCATDPSCMYCFPNEKLDSLMIYITDLEASKLYLFRDQTYRGRCIVAYNCHVKEFFELEEPELGAFSRDIKKTAAALSALFSADKINYGMFSDKLPHLHCHVVPKKEGGPAFGSMFDMNPHPPVFLSDGEYTQLVADIRKAVNAL